MTRLRRLVTKVACYCLSFTKEQWTAGRKRREISSSQGQERREGRNFPGRPVVRVLSLRGSLFCRPQTPRRMIHKTAIFRRVRLSSPALLQGRVSPSDRSIPSIVTRACVSSQTTPRRRNSSRRSSEGHRRGGGKVPGDKGKGGTGGGWKIRKRNSRSSMNIASRAVVSMSGVGRNISRRERLLNYSRRVSLPGSGSAIVEAPISRIPRANPPGVYIAPGILW